MSADARALAVKALERSLALTHPGMGGSLLAYRVGVLNALSELGAIDAEDVKHWTARFERAAQPLEPVEAEVHARCRLARASARRRSESGRDAQHDEARESFMAKLQALLETGSIDWRDRRAWVDKLDAVVPDTSPRPSPPPYNGAELQAVIVGPERRLGGLRITSAELYHDCVIVRWHLVVDEDEHWRTQVAAPDRADDLARAHGPHSLVDNIGTAYSLGPGGSWAMPNVLHLDQRPSVLPGASAFTPGPPSIPTRLSITCAAGKVQLSLEDAQR